MSRQLTPWRRGGPSVWGLQGDQNRFFDEIWQGFEVDPQAWPMERAFEFQPRLDLSESDSEVTVEVELPGLEQKDIDLSLTGDHLMLRGEKRREETREEGGGRSAVHRVERIYGRFERAVPLPCRVDPDGVQAAFKNGVLTVRLPKAPESQRRRVPIEVHSG